MTKLRQLQAAKQTYTGLHGQKRAPRQRLVRNPKVKINPQHKAISPRDLALLASACLIGAAICFFTTFPKHKQQTNIAPSSTIVSVPGGQFLPSLEHPLNVLVMGVDSNGQNTERFVGTRSDSMILVSLDPAKQKTGLISIPRDSRVHIANSKTTDKINSAHALGGPESAMATVSELVNAPIDRYLVVDKEGLKEIFASLGSVDVLVEKKMSYTDHTAKLHVDLEPGLQKLDANQVEQYVRFRHDAKGDIGRIERQQWFARQLLTKITEPEMLVKLPSLLNTIRQSVVTNLSIDEMARLFGFACHLNAKKVEMASLPGLPGNINGISYWLLDPTACDSICSKLIYNHANASNSTTNLASSNMADSAIAYAPVLNKNSADTGKQNWSAIIRYPKGCEDQVAALEEMLNKNGFTVRGKYKADLADCQHEQIIESSQKALSFNIDDLRNKLPNMHEWPTVINIDTPPAADFTFVITPNSKFASANSAPA